MQAGNSPNSFNPETQIRYELSDPSHVRLAVYNSVGQKIASLVDDYVDAGANAVAWNAHGMPSGIYFYRLEAGNSAQTGRMLLLK